ncbi:AAA family ATPase [Vibrio genomosp. F10]|uniref:AAA family ATPase n=1 Tax=Vibrio genomosp. F10 str. ZF-129 TaxID=1187848 RepID=A0A1E5B9M8_9VIBR|nr:AAA family ATPase [Vibrio genomosp. F10]OEE30618.1 AAA family ATPase [Vibrio genomosp. F10 str. ZF-129]OEF06691.1 AAA family ATPase [Vibrio genomosp. F10 str. 9ZB36]
MTQTFTLIRGLPGSGKSTLAQTMNAAHFEADMYFITAQGEYHYDAGLIQCAHEWCYKQTEQALFNGESVVVSNTFVRRWEILPYYHLARQFGLTLDVIECTGSYANIHDVDKKTITKMKKRWQQWQNDRQS